MTNLTLSIDENDLKLARLKALQEGTSLNAVVREYIETYIDKTKRYQQVTKRILQHAENSTFERGEKPWNRGDLYD